MNTLEQEVDKLYRQIRNFFTENDMNSNLGDEVLFFKKTLFDDLLNSVVKDLLRLDDIFDLPKFLCYWRNRDNNFYALPSPEPLYTIGFCDVDSKVYCLVTIFCNKDIVKRWPDDLVHYNYANIKIK